MRVLVIFVLNILSRRVLNIQRLSGRDQRGDRKIYGRLSEDDTIIFWIKLRFYGAFVSSRIVSLAGVDSKGSSMVILDKSK